MTADERVQNFALNWIDANVAHPVERGADLEELQRRFLTDAVASGLKLAEVNAEWDRLLAELQAAVRAADERETTS
ncbi:MAG TPA: hypothetical protein VFO36_09080 [Nitrospiraceae bacterium]|jgi:hypothetical protein|nr:hypothetical protein [Nitrospiraceae bacterium]